MHTPSTTTLAAPQMETSLESKFSAAFEQPMSAGSTSSGPMRPSSQQLLFNGGARSKVPPLPTSAAPPPPPPPPVTTTATPHTESGGEKTVSFRKGNDLESFESLSSLFANGLFTDLVICCPGKMFKCHRVVMAAASLYIRDALSSFYNNNPDGGGGGGGGSAGGAGGTGAGGHGSGGCNNCNTVMILPNDIKMADMEAILRFIYDGHVEVKVDSIESFLRSARMLNIKGLCNLNVVFNNNGAAATTDSHVEISGGAGGGGTAGGSGSTEARSHKNNGYRTMLNGHGAAGINSPPPSPPSVASALLNSSLASLKAMAAANQQPSHHLHSSSSSLPNGNHHHVANKFLNGGGGFNNQMLSHYRNNLSNNHHSTNSNKRDQSPLRANSVAESSILGHIPAPAHQSSAPKSLYAGANGGASSLFPPGASTSNQTTSLRFDSNVLAAAAAAAAAAVNSSSSSAAAAATSGSGSRRKQKYPTNIPFLAEMLPPAATALYNTWLNMANSEEEDDEDDLDEEGAIAATGAGSVTAGGGGSGTPSDKRLVVKDDSSNDCGSTVDNLSVTSLDQSRPVLPFGTGSGPVPSPFTPQMPCMIEVEADPTTFPTFSDFNDAGAAPLPSGGSSSKRRRPFRSPFGESGGRSSERHAAENKRLKLPFGGGGSAPNATSMDVSIVKPSSPLTAASSSSPSTSHQQAPPSDSKKNRPNQSASAVLAEKQPLFTAYTAAVKTAAGANPAAGGPGSSPSSNSSASGGGGGGGGGSWVGSKWKCDICNKYYGNKQTLKEHMDYFHSNREEQIYICNICNKEYTWRKSLMKHYRDIHQMRNTPALAEINRQLAALASAKARTAVANVSSGMVPSPGDPLQQYVSIANYSSRKPGAKSGGGGGGGSASSEKSIKSESEMDNDNTNDGLIMMGEEEDYGNDLDGLDGRSCTTEPESVSDEAPTALVVAPADGPSSPPSAAEEAKEDDGAGQPTAVAAADDDEDEASTAAAAEERPAAGSPTPSG